MSPDRRGPVGVAWYASGRHETAHPGCGAGRGRPGRPDPHRVRPAATRRPRARVRAALRGRPRAHARGGDRDRARDPAADPGAALGLRRRPVPGGPGPGAPPAPDQRLLDRGAGPERRRGAPGTEIPRTRTFGTDTTLARVSGSQLLFDFGKTFAATDVARKNAEVTLEDVELQRQLVTLAVKEAYTNINFAGRLIKVQLQALERAELNLKSARGFFEVGTRPKSDVTRAEVDVANARLGVIQARNAERVARVALNTAMGIAADTPTQIRDNLVYQQAEFDRRQLFAHAPASRPEYKQDQLRVDAAEAFVRQTLRNFFPDVTAGGFYGAQRAGMNAVWGLNIGLTRA